MITAVDTNILIDIFSGNPAFGRRSGQALQQCLDEGAVVVSDVVWAETTAAFADAAAAEAALLGLGVAYIAPSRHAAAAAGNAWRMYRAAGGPRTRVIGDFMVGAHASAHANRLLTRDRGFFRKYFNELTTVDPTDE